MPEVEQKWSLGASILLIVLSLVLFGGVVLLFRIGVLQQIFAHVMLLAIPASGFWTGYKVYQFLADSQPRPTYGPRARNWGPLGAAIIIGLTTALLVQSMFTHRTVRALDAIAASDSDDDE